MKKNIAIIFVMIGMLVGIYYLISTKDFTEPAMTFPEELEGNGCVGLTYHRIRNQNPLYSMIGFLTHSEELMKYSVYAEQFEEQMKTLKEQGATFLTPNELREAKRTGDIPIKCVWISFDDIDTSVYNNAFPILKKYEIPFTIFIIAGQVGKDFSNLEMASWEQLQEMVKSGLVTVGSHTYDMHAFSGEQPVFFLEDRFIDFKKDLLLSKKTLEENLAVEVNDFAYPFGNGQEKLAEAIKQSGYESASILAPRAITSDNDNYWLNRILVNQPVFEEHILPWVKK